MLKGEWKSKTVAVKKVYLLPGNEREVIPSMKLYVMVHFDNHVLLPGCELILFPGITNCYNNIMYKVIFLKVIAASCLDKQEVSH